MIEPIILPSGVTILAEERRDSPSFTLAVFLPFGSRNEAPQAGGFVHFLEHMLFKGTNRRGARELWADIERTGGYANGFTDRDELCIQVSVPARQWRIALDFACETCFASTFPEAEFERERQVILAEILQIEDEAEETAFDAFLARFWEGNPASRPIAGTKAQVEAITRRELLDFYAEAIHPTGALIAASGPLDASSLGAAVESSLESSLPSDRSVRGEPLGRRLLFPSTKPDAHAFSASTAVKAVGQVYYYDAIQLEPTKAPEDYVGLCLANSILGEASTSRIFSRLREKEGLAYTVQSSLSLGKCENLLLVQAICSEEKIRACVAAIDEEMEKLFSSGAGIEEFYDARSRLAGGFELSLEDPDARVRRMGHWFLSDGFLPSADEELRMYAEASKESLDRALFSLASGTRSRYAYGHIGARTRTAISFKEI
ncbi:MAG: pitrilysin family protein [Spirochaetes bacterium]|nr:pitrilysin family protein [Spirochaetota bacterium]